MSKETSKTKAAEPEKVERLLSEFEYPTYEQWREATEKSLKGAPFDKKLLTKTYEGITLKPMYNPDDVQALTHIGSLPGFAPYVRGVSATRQSAEPWKVCQEISHPSPAEMNKALLHDLERGQTAIRLVLDRAGLSGKDPDRAEPSDVGYGGVSIIATDDIAEILSNVEIERYPIYIKVDSAGVSVAALLAAHLRTCNIKLSNLNGCIENDPLGMLVMTGSSPRPLENLYSEMAALTAWAKEHAPSLQTIAVCGHHYHNAGGSAVDELAFSLATGVEYLRELINRNLLVDDIAPRVLFSMSVGANFFVEIAKLRAARLVWARAVEAFGGGEEAKKMTTHVCTSSWTKTINDPYVNMLRATTETFSAAMGGADSILTNPFDEPVRKSDAFSRRIARNVQIILQEESHLGQVIDPVGGSWYVEHLTDEIASRAWTLFQDVEKEGGMARAISAGIPQKKVAHTAEMRARDLDTRKAVFIGTNIYPNATEQPLDTKDLDHKVVTEKRSAKAATRLADADRTSNFLDKLIALQDASPKEMVEAAIEAASNGATLGEINQALTPTDSEIVRVKPVNIHRGATRHEKLRQASLRYEAETGKKPRVFLSNMGPISQHKARADFSTGFFEVGGFEVLGNDGFSSPEQAAQAAKAAGADIIVICSTDETYPELVPKFINSFNENNGNAKIVLAGYPKDQIEDHKKSGVDAFIHLRSNNYEMLADFLQGIGVAL
ncbi:MAG: methylmalonyl-CoA mutase [Proteobacteria bacterium]|nr:methylmalonyl-CoA mutase [Pseudomonadota bacterium]